MRCQPGEMGKQGSQKVHQRDVPSPAAEKEKLHVPIHVGGLPAVKQLYRRGRGSPASHQVEHEPVGHPYSKKTQQLPGWHKEESCHEVEGRDPSPLLNPAETRLGPVLGSPVQESMNIQN